MNKKNLHLFPIASLVIRRPRFWILSIVVSCLVPRLDCRPLCDLRPNDLSFVMRRRQVNSGKQTKQGKTPSAS